MPRQTNSPASRERRLRRDAERKGLTVRKIASGRERGRFVIAPADTDTRRGRGVAPRSLTLDEAEALVDD